MDLARISRAGWNLGGSSAGSGVRPTRQESPGQSGIPGCDRESTALFKSRLIVGISGSELDSSISFAARCLGRESSAGSAGRRIPAGSDGVLQESAVRGNLRLRTGFVGSVCGPTGIPGFGRVSSISGGKRRWLGRERSARRGATAFFKSRLFVGICGSELDSSAPFAAQCRGQESPASSAESNSGWESSAPKTNPVGVRRSKSRGVGVGGTATERDGRDAGRRERSI